jgi:16S rRNA (guanine527-N7)-methyltransferase
MLYNNYPEFYILEEGLSNLKIELTNLQKQQFIDYYELLIKKNKVMNLTAITEFKDIVNKHFIDSLSLVKVCQPINMKILDLGTGAGFPGIPLKIVYPETDILLLDSLNKRLIFLNEVITALDLKQIKTLHGRAEDFGKQIEYREKYDICVSRAVAKMSPLSELCLPFVKQGGVFISYKSGEIDAEMKEASSAFQKLGARLEKIEAFMLPGTDIQRSLVVVRKEKPTPKKYPRNAGKVLTEPIV